LRTVACVTHGNHGDRPTTRARSALDPAGRAGDIVPALRETDADSESQRGLSARAVELLHDAGLTALMSPAAYGGSQLPPRALVEAERVVAHGSPAASWVMMVCGAHTFMAGRLPRPGQDEIFGADAGVLIPGVPSSQGTCRRADGGFVLNGRWQFCSGVDHGAWIMLGSRGTRNDAGEPTPGMLVVLAKADVTVDDTWYTLGMRGTGSKDVVLEDAFVPDHRAVRMSDAFLGTVPDVEIPLYRLPVAATLATMLLGTIVGMSERGLQLFIEQTATRTDAYSGEPKSRGAGLQRRVAEANAEVAHAWSLARRNCDLLEAATEHPAPMPAPARAEVRWNAAYGAELCRRAADRLYAAAGAKANHDANPLQTVFRDVNTATHHAMLDFDTTLEMWGKVLLGVEQSDAMI
jgi:3-hydroxy-9,10-secoandrosta-1,3,5(10)-triene-9,17-dione monooxygenase